MKLEKLQQAAESARRAHEGWLWDGRNRPDEGRIGGVHCEDGQVEVLDFFAAASPQIILALIAVAEAVRYDHSHIAYEQGVQTTSEALAELDRLLAGEAV